MKRRLFIKYSTLATTPVLINGIGVSSILKSNILSNLGGDNDRVLVLIQLNGGNDGLNTLIPLDQYAALTAVRSSVLIPANKVLKINNETGLHPSMNDLNMVWQDGKVQFIQSVGYPNQNRSHFRSQDIWISGSSADQFWGTGWLGRYMDDLFPGYPEGFPNSDCPDPIAISIGTNVSETCQGVRGNFSQAVIDPNNISILEDPNLEPVPNNCYGMELSFLRDAVKQTNKYSDQIKRAGQKGTNKSVKYASNNPLAQKLKLVAQLISGGLKTKVYIVSITGFDTHGNQVNSNDKSTGVHANLLNQVSNAICAFQEDLEFMGLDKRVIGLTFSEFGRRIKTTAPGTDHGSAAPMILFGSCINPIILGTNPQISMNTTDLEGVTMQYDFRSVYGSILNQWFNVEDLKVQELLNKDYQTLPIIRGCSVSNSFDDFKVAGWTAEIIQNPVDNYLKLKIDTNTSIDLKIEIYNETGFLLKSKFIKAGLQGSNLVDIEVGDFIPGVYFVRLFDKTFQKNIRMIKV